MDVFWLKRQSFLTSPRPMTMTWSRNGLLLLELSLHTREGVLYVQNATAVELPYRDELSQMIQLEDQPRHVGGKATLFACPSCGSLRQYLYLNKNQRFVCQTCANLTYKVRRERKVARAFRRWSKASKSLGGVCWEGWYGRNRPKGMHKRRYEALCERLWAEEAMVNGGGVLIATVEASAPHRT